MSNVQHNRVSNSGRIPNAAVSVVTGQEEVLLLVHQACAEAQTPNKSGRGREENGKLCVGNELP